MAKPDSWQNPMLEVHRANESDPVILDCTVTQTYLTKVDEMVLEKKGVSIYELAETHPRDAYVYLGGLFAKKFIDPEAEGWKIGSPEQDGQQAFDGLTKYMEENRAPDPDIEEIDVALSVWKRGNLFDQIRGNRKVPKEVLRFRVEPQDLASC